MRSTSIKRQRENRLRNQLIDMDGFYPCVAKLVRCRGLATDRHEILTSGRGGSRLDPENVLRVCRSCHTIITDHTGWADRHGMTLPSWATPDDCADAVTIRARWKCSTDCSTDHRRIP
jgi:hypothetical protein